MGLRALATEVTVFHELLRVIPGTARVRQEHGHEHARGDGAGQVRTQCADAQAEADSDRCEHREDARGDELAERVARDDVDDLAVLRLLGAEHDARVLAELATHLEDHSAGSAGYRVDGEAREQEHDRGTDDQADQVRRGGDVEDARVLPRILDGVQDVVGTRRSRGADNRIAEGTEQRSRGKHCRRDRDALGDRLG